MKLPEPCATHKPIEGGYFKCEEKFERNCEQRQCPTCLRWYFYGEFGRGWKYAIRTQPPLTSE
jgi:hypothetical protein